MWTQSISIYLYFNILFIYLFFCFVVVLLYFMLDMDYLDDMDMMNVYYLIFIIKYKYYFIIIIWLLL